MDEQLELRCLATTLRTLSLSPTDILLAETRVPVNENDPLLRIARPTWVGRDYKAGGVLLLAKNPAGGSATHRLASHPSDPSLAEALNTLKVNRDIKSYRSWREVQLRVMSDEHAGWRIWRNSAMPVIRSLETSEHAIAFGNLVPFRTDGNNVKAEEIRRGWQQDISHVVALLDPSLIVEMAGGHQAFYKCCTDRAVLRFRRAIGDSRVTPEGADDLRAINDWAKRRMLNTRSASETA
jgi:hypothetical protein